MVKIPQKHKKTKTPMKQVIADCIANEQICYKCSYSSTCKQIQRNGLAKPYQYANSPDMQNRIFEELAV